MSLSRRSCTNSTFSNEACRTSSAWRNGRSASVAAKARPSSLVVLGRQLRSSAGRARQQDEEPREAVGVITHRRRQLPQYRPKLVPQGKHSRGEEVCQRHLNARKPFHVGDEAGPLTEKTKPSGVCERHCRYELGR
jgi:hypothetical protein